jgi:hypothetical protein
VVALVREVLRIKRPDREARAVAADTQVRVVVVVVVVVAHRAKAMLAAT